MKIFKRVTELVKANINHLLDQAEDPEVMVKQIIRDMEELVRFTALVRPHREALTDRYSERKAAGHVIDEATDLSSIAIAPQPLPESETS